MTEQAPVIERRPAWVRCDFCEDFWCVIHGLHVHDCACPPIEEWGEVDPYAVQARPPRATTCAAQADDGGKEE